MKRKKKVQGEWGFTVKQRSPVHSRKGLVLWRKVGERKAVFTEGEKCMAALSPGNSILHPGWHWRGLPSLSCLVEPGSIPLWAASLVHPLCTSSCPCHGSGCSDSKGDIPTVTLLTPSYSPSWWIVQVFPSNRLHKMNCSHMGVWTSSWKVEVLICICLRAGLQQSSHCFPPLKRTILKLFSFNLSYFASALLCSKHIKHAVHIRGIIQQ